MNILRHIPQSLTKLHQQVFPIKATGSYIYTRNKKFLDLTTGIGALSTGHNHPYILEAIQDQLNKYVHMPQQLFKSHPAQEELTKKLIKIMPDNSLDNFFYVNSGSEATDNAIKIARAYTGRSNIIAMNGGFHGRTLGALSITSSNLNCKKNINPLIPNIYFCSDFTEESLDKILDYQSAPENTAAIIVEPVQGERGIYSIDKDFMEYIRLICDRHNILFIADEIQCGSMRTGSWWNVEQKNVIPDIMAFGKGIASGFPLAGLVGKSSIMNSLEKGCLGGTYGGNAICSAAASATIDILNDEHIKRNIAEKGKYIKQSLITESKIKEIRQYGLMIGIELYNDCNITTLELVNSLREDGILVLVAGNKNQYIRLLPPLNISGNEIEYFINKFKYLLQ